MRKLVLAVACCLSLLSLARADEGMQMKHDDMQNGTTSKDDRMNDTMKHGDMQGGGMKHDDGTKPGSMAKAGKKKHGKGSMEKGSGMEKGEAMENGGKM